MKMLMNGLNLSLKIKYFVNEIIYRIMRDNWLNTGERIDKSRFELV